MRVQELKEKLDNLEKEKINHKCYNNNSSDVAKYKEYLAIIQAICKDLEAEALKSKESHDKQLRDHLAKLKECEKKLHQTIKEERNLEDKERILLNTFDALKELEGIKANKNKNDSAVLNRDDEINVDASTSSSHCCDFCNYKSTTERSLEQHVHDKHRGTKNSHKTSKNSANIP